jgi:1-phosphofructokinase
MRAVLIAGPNLTIDRTLAIEELRPGEVLRFTAAAVTPGGKGVNVARVAREMGLPALLAGFVPGRTGAAAAGLLADEGISLRGVPVGGEIRSTAVILERSGRVTVFNEPGPALASGDWERFEAEVADALEGQVVLACSGSLPPAAPVDGYARLVGLAHARETVAIVDVGGAALDAALAAGADVVTPNLAEAEGLLHGRADEDVDAAPDARERACAAAVELVRRGARAAVVTAAAAGAALAGLVTGMGATVLLVAVATSQVLAGIAAVAFLARRS